MLRKCLLLAVVVVMLSGLTGVVQAQENLLQDASFEVEGNYKRVAEGDNVTFDVPQAWNGWVTTTPRSESWMNFVPTGFPHFGLFKRHINRSLHIARGGATFTVAVFQTVTVPENANVVGSGWGFMERKAGSGSVVPGAQFRVGIDPTGGTNPLSPSIIWSNWVTTADGWYQATANATASGTSVTFFLYATQSQPSDPNGIYFDETSLTVGGPGGTAVPGQTPGGPTATPVIPTPAFASFVSPQPPQPDGSIIHTVQTGEVLDAIGVAYGMTRQEIIDLNPGLSPRFLQIGQRILIKPAPESEDDDGDETEAEETSEATTGTPDETLEGNIDPTDAAATTEAEGSAVPTATPEAEETSEIPSGASSVDSTAEATEETAATPTDVPPTATEAPPAPVTQVAQVNDPAAVSNVTGLCVWMFEDGNQNRIQESEEALLASGTITINTGGTTVETYTTDGTSEPFCFEDLSVGDYVAVAQAPEGYGLTTASQLSLRVQSGTTTNARFGAAHGVEAVVPPPADTAADVPPQVIDASQEDSGLSLLQISGLIVFALAALVMVGGIGAALILRRR